ncbi:hypothetical protein TTHERM_00803550 (macronuclear) [Tetrahymena thermophila SB210]|uniref:Transmembrane protein n=1 Tax=Tetrahymena thermophila (strain SB210) TaxID=312017 RepID=Q235E5_TETTS|nr:hypothetical protein TTHERM_00803550 [Tetrahymena thermophila SB210]EAR92158.2 hypothetical protein TTHERM_00803550 [Tetrahymena thermophila SB210]|eukprot:XP_001012403.2 hypothetical protein TTHERM_00803550 [Tetrahymena thermophila SB210]
MKAAIFIIVLIALASAQKESQFGVIENLFKNSKEQVYDLFEKIIHQGTSCEIVTAASCFGDLKGLFGDCTSAISTSGVNLMSDFLCIKSLWNLDSSKIKKCHGCVCDFAIAAKFYLPTCSNDKKLLQSGVNVFEELLQQQI